MWRPAGRLNPDTGQRRAVGVSVRLRNRISSGQTYLFSTTPGRSMCRRTRSNTVQGSCSTAGSVPRLNFEVRRFTLVHALGVPRWCGVTQDSSAPEHGTPRHNPLTRVYFDAHRPARVALCRSAMPKKTVLSVRSRRYLVSRVPLGFRPWITVSQAA